MKRVWEVLTTLKEHGITPRIAENQLKLRPPELVTREIEQLCRENYDELIELLKAQSPNETATSDAPCWRCSARPSDRPDLDRQVEIARSTYDSYPEVYQFGDRAWEQLLRKHLQPGDMLLIAANYHCVVNPTYGGVMVRRADGTVNLIERKELMDS